MDSNPKCFCTSISKLFTVTREGANKGRQFYACPKQMFTIIFINI